MKVQIECAECIVKRVIKEVSLATPDESLRFKAVKKILERVFKEFDFNVNPAVLGTLKDQLIKEITGVNDYYKNLKMEANKRALELIGKLKNRLNSFNSEYEKLRFSTLTAIAGNAMEFFISDTEFDLNEIGEIIENTENQLAIDNIKDFYNLLKKKKSALYLTDNAGEIAFDTLLVSQIRNMGVNITVAVREKPVMNDATMEDAEFVEMNKYSTEVITTGSGSIGLILDDCSRDFLNRLEKADIIIAKGMGYYETLGEVRINKPIMLLLRSKCKPIARALNVPLNKNIAKLVNSTSEI
ncbi:MAG: damage-control phosphatase ARMT1 family protein [Candidatus Odinarchaeia archaeon]